nr:MAG TPA: hypothetical protein [Caudoviricetes sp.]
MLQQLLLLKLISSLRYAPQNNDAWKLQFQKQLY